MKKKTTRKKNPLVKGYSPDAIGRNISHALKRGLSHAQAIAISLDVARREYRKVKPAGPFPRYLQGAGKYYRKNPISEKTAHKLRKAAPATFQSMTDEEIKRAVRVKKKKKKRAAKNPRSVARNPINQAIELFRKFREADPESVGMVPVKVPRAAMTVGELDAVLYTTTHGKKVVRYKHTFAPKSRPLLASSGDGRQLLILGGSYDFTQDGIVDRE